MVQNLFRYLVSFRLWQTDRRRTETSLAISRLNSVRSVFGLPCTNKKLISRWDSERELFTTTPYTYYEIQKRALAWSKYIHKYFHIVYRIRWNYAAVGYCAVQGHSRSLILVPIESSYTTSYYWLIVTYLISCTVSKLWSNFLWREWSASL